MPKTSNQFPPYVHITQEYAGTPDEYLNVTVGKAEDALTEANTKKRVATYKLVEVKEGKLEPVFSAIVG